MTEHMTYPADIAESAMYLRACADELRAKELDISAKVIERATGNIVECQSYRNWCLSVASKIDGARPEMFQTADSVFTWNQGVSPADYAELLAEQAERRRTP